MSPAPSYFALSYGLAGCYLPDSEPAVYRVTHRRELVAAIADTLALYEMPASCIRQVKARRLWAHAKRHGVSVIHFQINHKGNALNFSGLTRDEYIAALGDDADFGEA